MPDDPTNALRQLIRSYGLQIEYINLLVKHGQLQAGPAIEEIFVIHKKMDSAAERLYELVLTPQGSPAHRRALDPALIPDLQYI